MSTLPQALEEVTLQLVYSDGGARTELIKELSNVYPIALLPFFLRLSSDQVELVMRPDFAYIDDEGLLAVSTLVKKCFEGSINFFPEGYHSYFVSIFRNSKGPMAVQETTPDIRVISGHGYGGYKGGSIKIGRDEVNFSNISPADTLTILDTCNAAHALACMTGEFPDNPREFNSRKRRNLFRDAEIPVVCDRNEYVWAFQIGSLGQHENPSSNGGLTGMSLAFGDSLICCVLLALKYFTNDPTTNLDAYFDQEYNKMNMSLLEVSNHELLPFARLGKLQRLFESGVLSIDAAAIDNCEIFRRRQEWFLTTEKRLQLSESDQEFADLLIDQVVNKVLVWHNSNPDSIEKIDESEQAFKKILETLGVHRSRLVRVRLEWNEEDNTVMKDDEGTEFELWAVSCAITPDCLHDVRQAVRYGPELDDELPEETDRREG